MRMRYQVYFIPIGSDIRIILVGARVQGGGRHGRDPCRIGRTATAITATFAAKTTQHSTFLPTQGQEFLIEKSGYLGQFLWYIISP